MQILFITIVLPAIVVVGFALLFGLLRSDFHRLGPLSA